MTHDFRGVLAFYGYCLVGQLWKEMVINGLQPAGFDLTSKMNEYGWPLMIVQCHFPQGKNNEIHEHDHVVSTENTNTPFFTLHIFCFTSHSSLGIGKRRKTFGVHLSCLPKINKSRARFYVFI
jgi:hypothetical protein